jgi:hypothetical protein
MDNHPVDKVDLNDLLASSYPQNTRLELLPDELDDLSDAKIL